MTAGPTARTKRRRRAWPSGPDAKLLVVTGLAAVVAGLLVAGLILLVTNRPTEGPEPGEPIPLGLASALEEQVADEGAAYFPDLGGGSRGIWLAEEDSELVALSARVPGTADCYVDDTGTAGVFEDCEGNELRTTQLDRYRLRVKQEAPREGALLIELDRVILAPANVDK